MEMEPPVLIAVSAKMKPGAPATFSNKHMDKLLLRPYSWKHDWHIVPSLEETGIQDPRTHGTSFPAIPEEYYRQWPVKAVLPVWTDYDVPQLEI